ncbi:MAG: alpha/beta fold hydrolase [Acidobacteria bacterium]|nr:alpha/beta fold hydrolase [Acidobacteriota bacterium]
MNDQVTDLYSSFAEGGISRREFMSRATALGIAGAAAAALGPLAADPAQASSLAQAALAQLSAAKTLPLDVAEWSFMWVNVKRADMARGSFIGGQQMYVEYMVPTRVRKPFPIVLVHGGGGQGLDWMGTPDGRPGWFQHLVAEGYKVYVVDRPGHGRAPQHPDLHGGIPARPGTMEGLQGQFIFPAGGANNPDPYRRNHTQWPGEGVPGAPDVAQFLASQGGSYVVNPPAQAAAGRGGAAGAAGRGAGPAGAAPAGGAQAGGRGGRGGAQAGPPTPANQQPAGQPNLAHMEWRAAGAELLDKIGPAIIMTHSAGGSFGLLVAEARPNLVKATVMVEGGGSGFAGGNRWGMSTIPVTWDPPVKDPSEIKTRWVADTEIDAGGYFLQEEPARRLPNLRDVAVLTVTSAAGAASPGNPGAPAFLKQAGVRVAEELRLANAGIQGNSHMMMVEKNHREVLQPIIEWLDRNVRGSAPSIRKRGTESTAMRLANMGYFWVGAEVQKRDYGTIVFGQMYVQYLVPEQIRHPNPVVLVHGGGGQMTHYLGLDGNAGWAHYYVQNGYQVYLVDRPGHGRSPVSLDALGPIGNLPMMAGISADFVRAATGTPRRWMGTGQIGDPLLDQFVAGQNAAPTNGELMQRLWASRGAELLDKIGPAIIQTHSAGGPFGFIVANERPALTKGVVCFEGGAGPVLGQNNTPNPMPNLKGIPMMYLTAEASGRANGPTIVAALRQSGALAEHITLKDRGITGNGHFAMVETNRKEVFEVIRGWIESKLPATGPATRQTARG